MSDEADPRTATATVAPANETAAPVELPAYAGPYEIEGEHARGGLALILRAHDRRLGRRVALKLSSSPGGSGGWRFEREAQLTARLQHPSIVPVYEAGVLPGGERFYAMKFVEGKTLKELIAGTRTLRDRLALLPHVIDIAEAIAYAHSRGIIHRDLKPSNVVIGAFGETVVIDWGLAKELDDAEPTAPSVAPSGQADDATVVGAVVGTPAYMPPEQATGDRVDARADVYALGAILYHLLAGRPPYTGEHPSVLAQVVAAPPAALAGLAPRLPPELRDIVTKAMARDPAERYASAGELADDLLRFQTGQLVGVHAYTTWALLTRWVRRHRAPLAVAAALVTALVITAVVSFARIVSERNRARVRTAELTLAQARTALAVDPTATIAWLKEYPLDGADWRTARTLAVDATSRGVAEQVLAHPRACKGLSFSPSGERLAVLCGDGVLRIYPRQGGPPGLLTGHAQGRDLAAFVDDDTVVTAGIEGGVRRWELAARRSTLEIDDPAVGGRVAMTRDGETVVAGGESGELRLWRRGAARTLLRGAHPITAVAVAAGGRIAAAGLDDGTVLVVDDGVTVLASARHPARVYDVAFSPDGGRLAVAGAAPVVTLVSLADGSSRALAGHGDEVTRVVFSPDGSWLASGSVDATIRLWDAKGTARVLAGHEGWVSRLHFAPDGRSLISAGKDGTARVWDVATGESIVLAGQRGDIVAVAVSPDGGRLATAGQDGTVRVWRVPPRLGGVLVGHQGAIEGAAWSPDGQEVATAGADRTVRLWSAAGMPLHTVEGAGDRVMAVAWSPEGTTLAWVGLDGAVSLWERGSGPPRQLGRRCPGLNLAFSPDGRLLVAGCTDGSLLVLDRASGVERAVAAHRSKVTAVVFAPDGKSFATTSFDLGAFLWDSASLRSRPLSGHEDFIEELAFPAGGTRVAAAGDDGLLRVWGVPGGEPLVDLRRRDRILDLAFRPAAGGGELVFGAAGGVWRWRPVARAVPGQLGEVAGDALAVAASADGDRVAAACSDRTVRLWQAETGLARVFRGHAAPAAGVAFSPDGARLLSFGDDGVGHLWPASLGEVPSEPERLADWLRTVTSN